MWTYWCIWAHNLGFGTSEQSAVHWTHLAPNPHIHQAWTCLFDRVTSSFVPPYHNSAISPSASLSSFPTRNPSDSPSRGSFQKFQPKFLPGPPAGIQSQISNQPSLHITQPGYIKAVPPTIRPPHPVRVHSKLFPENTHVLTRAHIQLPPKQNYITIPQLYVVYKLTTTRPPSTDPTYHPSYSPTNIPFTCPTHTQSYTWSIPGHVGGHTGHNVLIFRDGSHFRFHSHIQLCIYSCARVKWIFLQWKSTKRLFRVHCSERPVSVR